VLAKVAAGYGGQDVGVITYKSTREWIEKNCFMPPWLKLFIIMVISPGPTRCGTCGRCFVIGRRWLPPSDHAMTELCSAITSPSAPTGCGASMGGSPSRRMPAGNNTVLVDVWDHPDPRAERIAAQVTEAALIQAIGGLEQGFAARRAVGHPFVDRCAAAGTGPVEPVLWSELEGGWMRSCSRSAGVARKRHRRGQGLSGLFTASTLKQARRRGRSRSAEGNRRARAQGMGMKGSTLTEGTSSIRTTIGMYPLLMFHTCTTSFRPRRAPALAVSMRGFNETKAFLEARLGLLSLLWA